MARPILMEDWRKCLSCEHCSDDDEGLYCKLERCAYMKEAATLRDKELLDILEREGATITDGVSGIYIAGEEKPLDELYEIVEIGLSPIVAIDEKGEHLLRYKDNFYVTRVADGEVVAAGALASLEWCEGYFKDIIERHIKGLPNGEAWQSWEG